MSSLIAAMINSADDHQTKPNMKYIKYEIYQLWNISIMKYTNYEIYQLWNISNLKYIKFEIYQKWNISNMK